MEKVDSLKEVEFDYILIAVKREKMAEEIKKQLFEYGIKEEKIVWDKPKPFASFFVRKNEISQRSLYYKE